MTEIKPAPKEQKPVTGGNMPSRDNSVDMAKLAADETMPKEEPQEAPAQDAPPQEGAPQEEAPMDAQAPVEDFDAKSAIDGLNTAIEETNARISRIEEVLDKLSEEETEEPEHAEKPEAGELEGNKEAPEEKSPDAAEAKPEEKPEEKKEAFHSKELSEVKTELATLKAQFAKMQNTGVKKTVSSSSVQTDPDMVSFDAVLDGLDFSKNGGA